MQISPGRRGKKLKGSWTLKQTRIPPPHPPHSSLGASSVDPTVMSCVAVHTVSALDTFSGSDQIPLSTCLNSSATLHKKNTPIYTQASHPLITFVDVPPLQTTCTLFHLRWWKPLLSRSGETDCWLQRDASKPSSASEGFHMWFLVQIVPEAVDKVAYFGFWRLHIS